MAQLANPGCVKVRIVLSFTSTTSAIIGVGRLGSSDLVMEVIYSAHGIDIGLGNYYFRGNGQKNGLPLSWLFHSR